MSDPQNFGLDELGQRLQAMGLPDKPPVVEPRLRPYQGAPLPAGQSANAQSVNGQTAAASSPRTIPPYESHYESRYDSPYVSREESPTPDPYSTSQESALYPGTPFGSAPAGSPANSTAGSTSSSTGSSASGTTTGSTANSAPNGSTWGSYAVPEHRGDPLAEDLPAPPVSPKALPTPAEDPNAPKSGFQRAIEAVRSTLPLIQRLLPLLEGNFANVLATLVGPQPGQHPQPQVHIDLEPLERSLTDLRTSHRDLRGQVQEQVVTLKRVEDHLERVREATDRNTLEQQELVEDLRSVGNRISTFAVIGLLLLAISLGLNIYFLVQLQHILR